MSLFRSMVGRAFGRVVAGAALFFIVGGHWGVMQGVAWTKMLWDYSQRAGSLVAGAKKTFDGEHPCRMCDSIKEAKGKEEKSPGVLAAAKKIELFMREGVDPLPKRVCGRWSLPRAMDEWREARFAEPPGPVPIGWVLAA
jgi:hypothetical protein